MQAIEYVSENAAAFAREIEQRFQRLPAEAGIVFVSVDAKKTTGGNTTGFDIKLGMSKNLTEDVGWALIQQVLHDEIVAKIITITASVYIGFAGKCRDESKVVPRS